MRIEDKERDAYIHDDLKAKTSYEVIKKIHDELYFDTAIDIGCGTGVYKREFERLGHSCLGVDGNSEAQPDMVADLREEHSFGIRDLVFSVEVAEHIEKEYDDIFVSNLTDHAKKWIVMTASPKRGSTSEYVKRSHVNEQPKDYWIEKIERKGFRYEKNMTEEFQDYYKTIPGMRKWFNHDLMIYVRVCDL